MDRIDDCEIECWMVGSPQKRQKLEETLKQIKALFRNRNISPEYICKALEFVCEHPDDYSCLQCYNKITGDYDTSTCASACESSHRRSFCFLIKDIHLNIIAEQKDKIVIITFYILSEEKDFRKKCNNEFKNLT
ncbi:hypothetical protein L3N51_02310 [Metallosphaera sp. J1]|uniref:hypothetical protein n=1 Tax=Metallosphaera javensis (ex Hofmann et al. 2022) TaxID=99938 RepID=UPI001EE12D9C|nr:hypothetical protein [Metallosphaera javensis (ex Hofmann et al. 2022)]MCG3110013.1 hypothetical protein [Metallosphaera javensis (ex Hofmann et al. 2022)]